MPPLSQPQPQVWSTHGTPCMQLGAVSCPTCVPSELYTAALTKEEWPRNSLSILPLLMPCTLRRQRCRLGGRRVGLGSVNPDWAVGNQRLRLHSHSNRGVT